MGTFGDRILEQEENPRLRNLKEKILMFDFKKRMQVWKQGVRIYCPITGQ